MVYFFDDPVKRPGDTDFYNPPGNWFDAFGEMAGATNEVMTEIDNTFAESDRLKDAYQARIERIHAETGVMLLNPIYSSEGYSGRQTADLVRRAAGGREDLQTMQEAIFAEKLTELREKFPEAGDMLTRPVKLDADKIAQDVKMRSDQAAADPALGPVGRFTAQMAGGIYGAAQDPLQWAFATIGAGAGVGASVAGRIGQVMLREAVVNAGAESVLQISARRSRKSAGLDYGIEDYARNVAIAGVFGSVFGGVVQGGREAGPMIGKALGLKKQAEIDASIRVLDNQAQPNDVVILAKATGQEITPENVNAIERSFAQDAIDEVIINDIATILPDDAPAGTAVQMARAADDYLNDPDVALRPELIEARAADAAFDEKRWADLEFDNAVDEMERELGFVSPVDPLEGQSLKHDPLVQQAETGAKPGLAVSDATLAAKDFPDPKLDKNGNVKNHFELSPLVDGDGNVTMRPMAEVLQVADEGKKLAALVDACNT